MTQAKLVDEPVFLPFLPRFREPVLRGVKTITTRSKKYGEPGDVLRTPFGLVRLTRVERRTLAHVRDNLWREEGVTCPDEFELVWREIHSTRGFQPDDVRVVHHFEVIHE